MATLAITAAISAGGMALQYLMRPRIEQNPIERGKNDDIRLIGSDYGAFIPRVWGRARMSGNLVFASGIDHEVLETPSPGGKGAPTAPPTRTHIYRTDAAIVFCRGEIVDFGRIWADQDIISNLGGADGTGTIQAESADIESGLSSGTDGSITYRTGYHSAGSSTFTTTLPAMPDQVPGRDVTQEVTDIAVVFRAAGNGTVDLVWNTINTTTVSFWDTGANWNYTASLETIYDDVTSLVIQNASAEIWIDKIIVTKFHQPIDEPWLSFGITQAVDPDITYDTTNNLDKPWPVYAYKPTYAAEGDATATQSSGETISFYLGTSDQPQDPAIIAELDRRFNDSDGNLRASAMRDLAYIMFDNRVLSQGRLENFTAELIESNTAVSIDDIIEELGADVGLSASDFTHDTNPPRSVTGFIETTAQSRKQVLDPLLRWSQRRLCELDGTIHVIYDGPIGVLWDAQNNTSYTHSVDRVLDMALDVGAHNPADAYPETLLRIEKREPSSIPQQVRASFMNTELEYRNDTADSDPLYNSDALNISEFAFPIIADFATAKTVADQLQRREALANAAIEWDGTPNMAKYTVGDVVQIDVPDENEAGSFLMYARIMNCVRELPFGKVTYQALTTAKIDDADDSNYGPQPSANNIAELKARDISYPKYPRNTVIEAIQSLPVEEKHDNKIGVYLAISGRGLGYWTNAGLYRERQTDNWEFQKSVDSPTRMGIAQSTLATVADHTIEDTTNTLVVHFFDEAALESVTAGEIAADPTVNLIRVGNEWIQYRTAASASLPNGSPYKSAWTISNLMRGRIGTEDVAETSGHAADEYASLYSNAMIFFELAESDVNQTVTLKAPTAGRPIDNAPATAITFAPANVALPEAAEALSAGELVNVYDDSGTSKVRLADATDPAKFASGYVLKGYAMSDNVLVRFSGQIPSSLKTAGIYYLGTTAGAVQTSAPSLTGEIVQIIGVAGDDGKVYFGAQEPRELR